MLPANRQYPPAFAVIEQLKAVDAAHERLGIARIIARFVRAPNVGNPAKLFSSPRDLFLVKAFLQKRFHAGDVSFDVQHLRFEVDIVSSGNARGRNYERSGIEQRALTIPVAILAGGS